MKASSKSAVLDFVLPTCNHLYGSVFHAAVQIIAILIISSVLNQAFWIETGEQEEWNFLVDFLILLCPMQQSPNRSTFITVDSSTDVDGAFEGTFILEDQDWFSARCDRKGVDLEWSL